jgi:hypothetical protein
MARRFTAPKREDYDTEEEYQKVTDHFYAVGLHRGWLQELDAQACYRPDFTNQQPFER